MQQFDIVENLNGVTRSRFPLVVVLQHDLIAGLPYILVGPLAHEASVKPLDHLRPAVTVDQQRYRIVIDQLAAVHRRTLGTTIGSLEAERYAIMRAIDLLFTGV